MNPHFARLLAALRDVHSVTRLDDADWDALLRHARAAGLLSRLAVDAQAAGLWHTLPPRVQRHMQSALAIADRQARAVRWEVHKIQGAFAGAAFPVVLLKGAAYVMADLPAARGRLFGDIDLLVPRAHLAEAETRLQFHGWHGDRRNAYDQRYYREWMHEIPPVTHITRGSTLDLHHNILPPTARLKPRAELLLEAIVPLPELPGLYRLGDADLVLHSATHLFHEGEWGSGLRDLSDLHLLLAQFRSQPGFAAQLEQRARHLHLLRPLHLALHFVARLLDGTLPAPPLSAFDRHLFRRGFAQAHPQLRPPASAAALAYLYVRSHWLRMPLRLLLPHLWYKATHRACE